MFSLRSRDPVPLKNLLLGSSLAWYFSLMPTGLHNLLCLRREAVEMRSQPIVAFEQMLGHYFCFRHDRHEIGIAIPAWHHMPMQVVLNARPGAAAQIHPQINASWI